MRRHCTKDIKANHVFCISAIYQKDAHYATLQIPDIKIKIYQMLHKMIQKWEVQVL